MQQSIRSPSPSASNVGLAVALAASLGTVAQPATEHQSALSDHLEPLERTLGHWDVTFTDENGQTVRTRYASRAELGGLIVVGNYGPAELSSGERSVLQVLSWRPELRTIEMLSWGSAGDFRSLVLVHATDSRRVWQARGLEPDGKLLTYVGTVRIADDNMWRWQETQRFLGGQPQPDGPELTFRRINEASSPPKEGTPSLNERLEPWQEQIGDWNVTIKDPSGERVRTRYSVCPEAGGTVLVGKYRPYVLGGVELEALVVHYWQPGSKTLAWEVFSTIGCSSALMVSQTDNSKLWRIRGHDPEGKFRCSTGQDERIDEDTWTWQFTQVYVGGQPQPDWPKFNYKRIKP